MILQWPSVLPKPDRNSWQNTLQDGRRKAQPEAGPPRYRRRISNPAQLVQMSLTLDRDQREVFDAFYRDCGNGTGLFYMPDPTTDGWGLYTSDGQPLLSGDVPILLSARWLCSWGDQMPSETVIGVEFRKSFSVVVMP